MTLRTYWHQILDSRGAGLALIERTIAIRYQYALAGILWSIIRPVAITAVFTIIFTILFPLPAQYAPYALLALIGSIIWSSFASGVTNATMSLVVNDQIVKKTPIPRIWIPISSVAVDVLECVIGLCIAECICIAYGFALTSRLLVIPAMFSTLFMLTLALGMLLAPLQARYRTIHHILPLILQIGIVTTAVGYTTDTLPPALKPLAFYNPLNGIIETTRWAFLHNNINIVPGFLTTICITLAIALISLALYKRQEGTLADSL